MRKVFKIVIYVVVGLVVIGALGAFAAQMHRFPVALEHVIGHAHVTKRLAPRKRIKA